MMADYEDCFQFYLYGYIFVSIDIHALRLNSAEVMSWRVTLVFAWGWDCSVCIVVVCLPLKPESGGRKSPG